MAKGGVGDQSMLPYERMESERIEDYVILNETVEKSVDEGLDLDASVRQDLHIDDGADLEDLVIDADIDLDARVRVDLDVDDGEDLDDAEQDEGANKVVGERTESIYVNPIGYVSEEEDGELKNDEDVCEDTNDSEKKDGMNLEVEIQTSEGDRGYFTLGMTFADAKEARETINLYGVKFGYKLRFEKNEKTRLRVRCINDNECPFKILVSKNGENAGLAVKTAYLEHNCFRQREVLSASQGFIAKYFKDLLYKNPKFRVKDMQTEISKHLNIYVSEHKCRRAKKMIIHELEESCKQEFASLSAYAEMVKESIPGSKCDEMPGRPGKKRVQASNEQRSSANHVSRMGQIQRCSICKAIGHKKTFCPTQLTQATGTSQSSSRSKPKKTVPRRQFNASNKTSGIGCHVDLSSGETTINLGKSSQRVINEGETPCINDLVVRGPIPNEREINQAKRKLIDISFSGEGSEVRRPELQWNGSPSITTIKLLEHRETIKKGKGKHGDTAVLDAEKNVGGIAKASSRSRGVENKPKAETEISDCEVICTRSVSNGRVLRRPRGSTTEGQGTGKLDSGMFEIHIESIWRELSEEKKNEFAYVNSLWFSLHSKGGYKAKVLSWIKKKDIFSKKYVFVPIVQWGHWSLLIFCHLGENSEAKSERRCMLLLDSLRKAHSKQLEPGIRRFVSDIFKTGERPENKEQIKKLPLLIPKVPQQLNGEECGYFVLYYINQFLKSDPDNFIFPTGYTRFMKEDWFTPEDVECFVKTLDSTTECSD